MNNKIIQLFESKKENIISLYITAGFPDLPRFDEILHVLAQSEADIIEIGIPFSDPMADGSIIRQSHERVLARGITLSQIFTLLEGHPLCRKKPVYLMGYFNPFFKFGMEPLLEQSHLIGIDGFIIPDLPLAYYKQHYKALFKKNALVPMFLASPATSEKRLNEIYHNSRGPVYMVSSYTITGNFSREMLVNPYYSNSPDYLSWRSRTLIGFGIHDSASFKMACRYARGAIIGSAFIEHLQQHQNYETSIPAFIGQIRSQT